MDLYSSLNKHATINSTTPLPDQEEESGWTAYFEDLSNSIKEESFCFSSIGSSSMVSDATSSPAWKSSQANHLAHKSSFGVSPDRPKQLTFKKGRTREIYHDDSLEDTASSPVSSPKVSDFGSVAINPRRATNDHFSTTSSLGKGKSSMQRQRQMKGVKWILMGRMTALN